MIRAIVTDIEGTTSSISFVTNVLFPYARAHMDEFVRAHAEDAEVRGLLGEVGKECGRVLDDGEAIAQLLRWIDEDRKIHSLKALQGMIWEAGYHHGYFHGHVYPDAVRKLRDWHSVGVPLYVYSSGSVFAQKLLFGHTEFGDLTPLFAGFYDTGVGSKQDADSYRNIALSIGCQPQEILFLSDTALELDAAQAVGYKTCQLVREGAKASLLHPWASDFDGIIVPN